jgi:predicted GIY-YIG superfamily endonuclease
MILIRFISLPSSDSCNKSRLVIEPAGVSTPFGANYARVLQNLVLARRHLHERGVSVGVSDAWVYMLRCADGSLYTGWSVDVPHRLARHRAGRASRYTASRLPVELALALPVADRTAARREEARIKRLPREQKLALIAAASERAAEPAA